ncbi:ATP-binding protein [Congregibacter variabilis]|uniref:histidine kinase n=1 Tax=Congregibacter variabilis TaxID=3081200 RepID=A0ABZ0I6H2_9GAMM|nr:ATP-binding protein [Congregibacter sp. IMCC43200]
MQRFIVGWKNMGFNRFSILLALRLVLIMVLLLSLLYFIVEPGFHAASLLVFGLLLMLSYEIFRFVSRTNQEISRFLDAARYADFGQRFELGPLGAGFDELGSSFASILERFREQRKGQERELRYLKALLEHVPVPLLSLHADGRISLWNNTARRLFGSDHVTQLGDLANYGEDFAARVEAAEPGSRYLANFSVEGMERRITIAASQIVLEGKSERLISLQDIQSELDGNQLEAWQDLVRVLTHEIMNSITPVASLAKTSVDLLDDAASKVTDHPDVVAELADVKHAVDTVARRSDSLMSFVSSYRRLTQIPAPQKSEFEVSDLFEAVARLADSEQETPGLDLEFQIEPQNLKLVADRGMLEQVLINIVQNAQHALRERSGPRLLVRARLNRRRNICIDVIDNGPGISGELKRKIFVPFFTTKREGSGVGLALSRQIMIAHGGSISIAEADPQGAMFTLTF